MRQCWHQYYSRYHLTERMHFELLRCNYDRTLLIACPTASNTNQHNMDTIGHSRSSARFFSQRARARIARDLPKPHVMLAQCECDGGNPSFHAKRHLVTCTGPSSPAASEEGRSGRCTRPNCKIHERNDNKVNLRMYYTYTIGGQSVGVRTDAKTSEQGNKYAARNKASCNSLNKTSV